MSKSNDVNNTSNTSVYNTIVDKLVKITTTMIITTLTIKKTLKI